MKVFAVCFSIFIGLAAAMPKIGRNIFNEVSVYYILKGDNCIRASPEYRSHGINAFINEN